MITVMLLVGIIISFFGAGRLLLLIYDWRQDCHLFSEGFRTKARVINRVTYPNEDELQSSQYRLIADFKDGEGYTHHVKSRRHMCGSRSRELMATEFEVVYLKENPERARFALDQKKHISWFGVIIYSLTVAAGILFILSSIFTS